MTLGGGNGGHGARGTDGKIGRPERTETKIQIGPNGKPIERRVIVPGQAGTDGTDATHGGNGGNGGNLSLTYSTAGFIPVFNQYSRKENSIIIINSAGSRGLAGKPGKGGTYSKDGSILPANIRDSHNGHIQFINMDSSSNL